MELFLKILLFSLTNPSFGFAGEGCIAFWKKMPLGGRESLAAGLDVPQRGSSRPTPTAARARGPTWGQCF